MIEEVTVITEATTVDNNSNEFENIFDVLVTDVIQVSEKSDDDDDAESRNDGIDQSRTSCVGHVLSLVILT